MNFQSPEELQAYYKAIRNRLDPPKPKMIWRPKPKPAPPPPAPTSAAAPPPSASAPAQERLDYMLERLHNRTLPLSRANIRRLSYLYDEVSGFEVGTLYKDVRFKNVVNVRWQWFKEAYMLAKGDLSLAGMLCNRDHTTILNAMKILGVTDFSRPPSSHG